MKLVFVYNADSGLLNGLLDLLHKKISPSTYACNLCAVTYDDFGMRSDWRDFVEGLPADVAFLHRDELRERHGIGDVELPAIFRQDEGGTLHVWLDAGSINEAESLDDLKSLVLERLRARERRSES